MQTVSVCTRCRLINQAASHACGSLAAPDSSSYSLIVCHRCWDILTKTGCVFSCVKIGMQCLQSQYCRLLPWSLFLKMSTFLRISYNIFYHILPHPNSSQIHLPCTIHLTSYCLKKEREKNKEKNKETKRQDKKKKKKREKKVHIVESDLCSATASYSEACHGTYMIRTSTIPLRKCIFLLSVPMSCR